MARPFRSTTRRGSPSCNSQPTKDELDALLDEAALDEEQEKKLQQTFGKQYHLITRNDRLDGIATDLVRHFSARGYLGKAMFVAIDKATAVRMHDKVRKAWAAELAARADQLAKASRRPRPVSPSAWTGCVPWTWLLWSASRRTRSTT
jgi:type I restriction enzyme R subunit